MISIRAAPAAALARASGVRATPPVPTSAAFLPGRARASLAPSRVARLAPARPARLSRAAAIPHAAASPAVRFAPRARRVAVVAGASAVAADGSASSPNDDDAGSAGSKLGAIVAVALVVATAVAFAYGDLEPLVGAVNAEKMAPAQDVVRVALAATRSGAERVADGAVEAALDIFDYAVLFAAKCQGLFAKLVSGSAGPEGASASGMAVATTPVGAFAARVAGGAAYFVDAAANGQWAKILCYKPFRTVAAVTLTLMRIVVSWFLSGVEFACSMLYATPAYVAVVVVLAVVIVRGLKSADAAKTPTNVAEDAETGATETTVAEVAEDAETSSAEVAETVAETSFAAAEAAEPTENAESAATMPASAVFEASDRLMTEEEKITMMRRVEEAKAQSSSASLSSSYSSYTSSTSTSSSSYGASSSYDYGGSSSYDYGGSSSYDYGGSSSYVGSSTSDVDQAEVDRIYAELTQKYSLESESSSAQSASSSLPAALPTSTSSSEFDADSFLSAFASNGEYKVADYDATAYTKDVAAASQTAKMSSAATSSSSSSSSSTMKASATRETKSMEATRETKSMKASATRETKSMEAAGTENRVSRKELDLSKVNVGKVGSFIESAAKKALEIGGPVAEKGLRETVELTKVVVPSVPKLLQGSVQGTRKGKAASNSAKKTRSERAGEVKAAARAAKPTEETTTTEETVTTTTEVVTETKSMEMSAETMEETGTVWKKKNKSSE